MIFMGWWKDPEGKTHRGLVKAECADDAWDILRNSLQEGYRAENIMFWGNNITPDMVCVNFQNMSEYTLFG